MFKSKWPILLLSLIAAAICFYYGHSIAFKDQWTLFESLRTTASIIFAVIGAWITLIFPEALAKILNPKYEGKVDEMRKVENLLSPMRYSVGILASVLIIGMAAPILKQTPFLVAHVGVVRRCSFAMLGMLTTIQLWTLLLTIAPGEIIKEDIKNDQLEREQLNKFQSLVKRLKK